MKVVAVLIDNPKQITEAQMESQVADWGFGMMVHLFSACDAPVAKTAFIDGMALKWRIVSAQFNLSLAEHNVILWILANI